MKIDFLKKVSLMTAAVLLVSSIVGCGNGEKKNEESIETEAQETVENEGMQTVTDSVGRSVEIPDPVTKAVVANAYNTEIINAIDALDCVIGVDYNIYQDKESWKDVYKRQIKHEVESIKLIVGHGIEGDAHAGNWHRQISLLAEESIDTMRGHGIELANGVFAENINTVGICLLYTSILSLPQQSDPISIHILHVRKGGPHRRAFQPF